jgi:hypothetical protein
MELRHAWASVPVARAASKRELAAKHGERRLVSRVDGLSRELGLVRILCAFRATDRSMVCARVS